jgi:hypothetical protein
MHLPCRSNIGPSINGGSPSPPHHELLCPLATSFECELTLVVVARNQATMLKGLRLRVEAGMHWQLRFCLHSVIGCYTEHRPFSATL